MTRLLPAVSLFVGEQEISLAKECKPCSGKGKVVDYDAESVAACAACRGTGARLSFTGWDLLNFITRYNDHPDEALTEDEALDELL